MRLNITLLMVVILWGGTAVLKAERPNVLFLAIDDLNTWLLGDEGRYAGKVVAPNLRKFAKTGVVFERAYTASPVCSPSRTALFSGVRPWQSGLYQNGVQTEKSTALTKAVFLPKLFKDAGYYLASYGKITHGWGDRQVWDDHRPHKRDPAPPNAPLTQSGRGEQDWGPTHLPEAKMGDTQYAEAAIAQLQRQHDRPFLIACGLFHPHMPWYVPQKYFDLFPLDEVQLPAMRKDDLADVPPLGRTVGARKHKYVQSIIAHNEHREAVQAYLATTAYADAQMGRVLAALEQSPYRDNTIVVLISDHGFHLGEKQHWQKSSLWEEATHCLLMARVPGLTRAGGRSGRCVSLQDLYPTFTELCRLQSPATVAGRSLVPLLKNPNAPWKSTAITAYDDQYLSLRTEQFRYIRYRTDQEELYDIAKDPREWTNLAGQPQHAATLRQLRTALPPFTEMAKPLPRKLRQK